MATTPGLPTGKTPQEEFDAKCIEFFERFVPRLYELCDKLTAIGRSPSLGLDDQRLFNDENKAGVLISKVNPRTKKEMPLWLFLDEHDKGKNLRVYYSSGGNQSGSFSVEDSPTGYEHLAPYVEVLIPWAEKYFPAAEEFIERKQREHFREPIQKMDAFASAFLTPK